MNSNPLFREALNPRSDAVVEVANSLPRWVAWVPLLGRWLSRHLRNHAAAKAHANRLELFGLSARLYAESKDVADLRLEMLAINYSNSPKEIDRAELHSVRVGMRSLARRSDSLQAHYVIQPKAAQWMRLDVDLRESDVRSALEGIPDSPHSKYWHPPDVHVQLTFVLEGKARSRVYFDHSLPLAQCNGPVEMLTTLTARP